MSSVDWTAVPEDFHYLDNLVLQQRIDELLVVPWVEEISRPACLAERTHLGLGGLTSTELDDLERVHHEICQREDNFTILEWIENTSAEKERISASWIKRLLLLLRVFGEFRVSPFCDHMIVAEIVRKPTWGNLPQDLHYLKDAFEKYCLPLREDAGPVERGLFFLKQFTQWSWARKRELRDVGKRIVRDRKKIRTWYEQFEKTPEANAFRDLEDVLSNVEAIPIPLW